MSNSHRARVANVIRGQRRDELQDRQPVRWSNTLSREALTSTVDDHTPVHAVLAEDDEDMRRMVSFWLRKAGFRVTELQDGAALARRLTTSQLGIENAPIDVIVSDVGMPGMSGLAVLASLRQHDSFTPVVLITAFAERALVAEAERMGAIVLCKPFDAAQLLRSMDRLGLLEAPVASGAAQ